MKVIRSKAPFRIGLAGGGTDVSPYSDQYGGAVLNSSISLFAHCTIIPNDSGKIVIKAPNRNEIFEVNSSMELDITGTLDLQRGVYNRVVREFVKHPLSFEMTTYMDVPTGSGLGTSSTLVVSVIGAFREWFGLPLGESDIARLAYDIERKELKMAGGKQDQYAATFGGLNFLEFKNENVVIVNPIKIKEETLRELEHNLLLFHTKTTRDSSDVINLQTKNLTSGVKKSIQSLHEIKQQAFEMKEYILTNKLNKVGTILAENWMNKKNLSEGITNDYLDNIYDTALSNGAIGGKISGAGGGGFMIFYSQDGYRHQLIKALENLGCSHTQYQFNQQGMTSWTSIH